MSCSWLQLLKQQSQPISSQECRAYTKGNKNANVFNKRMTYGVYVGSATRTPGTQTTLPDDATCRAWGAVKQSSGELCIFNIQVSERVTGLGIVTGTQFTDKKHPGVQQGKAGSFSAAACTEPEGKAVRHGASAAPCHKSLPSRYCFSAVTSARSPSNSSCTLRTRDRQAPPAHCSIHTSTSFHIQLPPQLMLQAI